MLLHDFQTCESDLPTLMRELHSAVSDFSASARDNARPTSHFFTVLSDLPGAARDLITGVSQFNSPVPDFRRR